MGLISVRVPSPQAAQAFCPAVATLIRMWGKLPLMPPLSHLDIHFGVIFGIFIWNLLFFLVRES
ncbi:hypothetical protein SBA1_780009 [Candidatus Sulfotelmatobacter kueseliae]|uniref:Uncharacterized protein n=1 Tax=Candidatus Sulfotelmatobacter kueseliae TaxID=2042962 RepID=A0A2U3L7B6_9BACT|nr:hypothetical protein SBA1_780009 [Candidatus Sulfotelmatobacter kueseliae]